MTEFTADDINKLPKWARLRINVLEMRLRELSERLAIGNTPSRIYLGMPAVTSGMIDSRKFVHELSVVFQITESAALRFTLDERTNRVEVYASCRNSVNELHVQPRSSNVLELVIT